MHEDQPRIEVGFHSPHAIMPRTHPRVLLALRVDSEVIGVGKRVNCVRYLTGGFYTSQDFKRAVDHVRGLIPSRDFR